MRVYNPKNCFKYANKVTSIDKAINAEAPTIATFKREKSREFTLNLIMMWLVYLNAMLNLNKPMSEEQIEMCAEEIINEFYALKISDLTLLFKRIIAGSYGEFFESISTAKLLSYFRDYFNERCEFAEKESQRNHNDLKSDETFNYTKNVRRLLDSDGKSKHFSK